jgi:hypothetical protein
MEQRQPRAEPSVREPSHEQTVRELVSRFNARDLEGLLDLGYAFAPGGSSR